MSEWIEINLPWNYRDNTTYDDYVPYPDLSVEMKEKFGYTKEELERKFSDGEQFVWGNPDYRLFNEYRSDISDQVSKEYPDASSEERKKEIKSRLVALNHPIVNKMLDFITRSVELTDWVNDHPAFIAAFEENEKRRKVVIDAANQLSFYGRGLCKAGTVIEVQFASDGSVHQMMIGDINDVGGACDDCAGISNNDIVLRYKIVWEAEK